MRPDVTLRPRIDLEGRAVGIGAPVFVIAEIGVNHNGDLDTARQMIDAAATCGVDAVKFQTFRTDEFLADRQQVYEYEVRGENVRENMYDMFKRLELPLAWHRELFDHARKRHLVPLTSVADPESADAVEAIGVAAYKLSSEDLINLPLVEHVARKGKPLLLSTGMADADEIDDVLGILARCGADQALFLHCVSLYPTPPAEAHLQRLVALREKVRGPVGYSDHTLGLLASLGAVALGACLLEKHFTLDRRMAGPDHRISADPAELKALVGQVRELEAMQGEKGFLLSEREIEIRKQFRRSLVASRDLAAGHALGWDDLLLKRPGQGIRARDREKVLGRRLNRDLPRDGVITWEMLD